MKYLHHMRDSFPDVNIVECVASLFTMLDFRVRTEEENLSRLRAFDLARDYANEVQDAIPTD